MGKEIDYEELEKDRESHVLNDHFIDYGMRLGYFPVYKEQLRYNETFRKLPPVWKCYYFLLQSDFNLSEGPFYKRDADYAAMLNVSLKSNNISKARNSFVKSNFIETVRGFVNSNGQRKATEYTWVEYSKVPEIGSGHQYAKIDRATFFYLLYTLRNETRFHDVIIVWIALVYTSLLHGGAEASFHDDRYVNHFGVNKKDIALLTNQSQPKIKRGLDRLQELGFIKRWTEPRRYSYYIEHFTLYGHDSKYGYIYSLEQWIKHVNPINDFLDIIKYEGENYSEAKIQLDAKNTIERYSEIFEVYRKCFYELCKTYPPGIENEAERVIQLGTLTKRIGSDEIKQGIKDFFGVLKDADIKGDDQPSIRSLYNYLSTKHAPKSNRRKIAKQSSVEFDILDDELPF